MSIRSSSLRRSSKKRPRSTPRSKVQPTKKINSGVLPASVSTAIDQAVSEYRRRLQDSLDETVQEFRQKLVNQLAGSALATGSRPTKSRHRKKRPSKRPPTTWSAPITLPLLNERERTLCRAFATYLAKCKLERETRDEILRRLSEEASAQGIKLVLNTSTMSKMTKFQKCVRDAATVRFLRNLLQL